MLRFVMFVAGALSVAACATQAQMQAQAISTNTTAAANSGVACVRAVYDSRDFDPLRESVPFNPLEATIRQLADTRKATGAQINAIFIVHPRYQQCRTALLSQLSVSTPTVGAIMTAAWTRNDADIVEVVQKKIAWGEYVQRARAVGAQSQGQITSEFQRINAGLQQSHEAELQRRQAAANALAAYAQQQQIINNMNRARVTNCTAFGNTVNCVTQ